MADTSRIVASDDLNIIIEDLDQGRSVTNDAISVIDSLDIRLHNGIGKRRVFYKDTSGRFDQLCVKNSKFDKNNK